jgi:hypothetical protein
MRDGCDTPSQQHPGYVQGTKPHLPTPKDPTGLRAQPSETFKVLSYINSKEIKRFVQKI